MDTPIGELTVVADEQGRLRAVDWTDHEPRLRRLLRLHYGEHGFALEPATRPRRRHRRRCRPTSRATSRASSACRWRPGERAFQRAVWAALRGIPCGTTVSYAELARAHRSAHPPSAPSGLANGANPVGVVVPCHRVVGKSGALTGYGGGLDRKRWLLAHEAASGRRRDDRPRPEAAQVFRRLHGQGLLVLANAWDGGSARLMQSLGAKASPRPAPAVAWSHGFADGDFLPVPLLAATVADMARVLTVPLSVDIEGGYSTDPSAVGDTVARVIDVGAVGINIEDGSGPRTCSAPRSSRPVAPAAGSAWTCSSTRAPTSTCAASRPGRAVSRRRWLAPSAIVARAPTASSSPA